MESTTPIRINRLPIGIVCYADGNVSFERLCRFKPMVDYSGDGLQICISEEDVVIGTETYQYGEMVYYKNEPELLAWLQSQEMAMPSFI